MSSVSAHSASGDESATMPPPTEKCVHPVPDVPNTVKVRMATARSAVRARDRRSRVDPPERAAVHAAPHRLELFDGLQHARLRRAGDRRRWEASRASSAPQPDVGAQACRGRCSRDDADPGAPRPRTASGTCIDPGTHTRPRSLRARSTIITFSAWSLALARSARGIDVGALDRSRLDVAVAHDAGSARATPTRPRSGSPCSERRSSAGVRCRVRVRERRVQRDRVEPVVAREPPGEVHLVALAGAEQLENRVDAVGVVVTVETRCHAPLGGSGRQRETPSGARRRRPRGRAGGGRCPSPRTTTEPPRGSTHREGVEAGEHRGRGRHGLGRGRRPGHDPLGGVAELERAPTDPEPGRRARRGRRRRPEPIRDQRPRRVDADERRAVRGGPQSRRHRRRQPR